MFLDELFSKNFLIICTNISHSWWCSEVRVILTHLSINRYILVGVSLILHDVDGPDLPVKCFPGLWVKDETASILKCWIVIVYYLKVNNYDLDKLFSNNFLIISWTSPIYSDVLKCEASTGMPSHIEIEIELFRNEAFRLWPSWLCSAVCNLFHLWRNLRSLRAFRLNLNWNSSVLQYFANNIPAQS